MNYATIKWTDIANGEGVRISLFVSGCTHRCKNCFNEIAWDFSYGEPFDEAVEKRILDELGSSFIAGLSLLGGEPLEPQNQKALYPFIQKVKKLYPNKTIWCYTGFIWEELIRQMDADKNLETILNNIDVLLDGKFILRLALEKLQYVGSSNQCIVDVKKSLEKDKKILYIDNNKLLEGEDI